MKKTLSFLVITLVILVNINGQNSKRTLNHDDIASWNNIKETAVSRDGKWIVYKVEPWQGDSYLRLYNSKGESIQSFKCGTDATVSFDSEFLVFKTTPEFDVVRELKLKKTKKDDMPMDILNIYSIRSGENIKIERITGSSLPDKWGGWIAYQYEPAKEDKKSKEDAEEEEDSKKGKNESEKTGYTLNLRNLKSDSIITWPFVTRYGFADEAPFLIFTSTGDDEDLLAGIYLYDIANSELNPLLTGEGEYKQTLLAKDGSMAAFLFNREEKPAIDDYSLYLGSSSGKASVVVTNSTDGIPENWRVSENGKLTFSRDMKKIFLGTAPVMPEKDTMRIDDEYPDVHIWHGTEGKLHTAQIVDKSKDLKKSFTAVYHFDSDNFIQLGTSEIPDVTIIDEGNSNWALAGSNVPYQLQTMWEGYPVHYDAYLVNISSGERKLIKKDARARFDASPAGKYIYWYNYMDSSFYTYDIFGSKEYRITNPATLQVANELNDMPNPPSPYGFTGWLENDEALLINDRYDIWEVDPVAAKAPVNITVNGRQNRITYKMVSFDWEKRSINRLEPLFLLGINEVTRESFYYFLGLKKTGKPEFLLGGDFSLSRPVKAKDADTYVYTKSTFEVFPDLLVTDNRFRKSIKISDANPQQKDYKWGSAELVSWTSLDGRTVEGLLYKPAGFDPSVKYPMIVNFYEKSSQGLYGHRTPQLHRSTIDYHYYTSNGYLIFNPDIYYKDGYPGESAYNCIMPGITSLVEKGFVDVDHIGAQGHSWGGYQVAYMATRTSLFAAIESGAPVVNMFSAYGGIRWGSGLNRSFQYEHTQSRIGATIWESPLRYIENSPLFTMDKVTTPILIMHNDKDGHVPWYQGIEYFIALRRLQKPVWMLNYTGEPHWPQKFKNKKDFQIRMAQFFAHFLKEEPMPKWMKEGIPAIMKDHDLGYELIEVKK